MVRGWWRSVCAAMGILLLVFSIPATAADTPPLPYSFEQPFTPSYTDLGQTGLWQMPNARMQQDGMLQTGISNVWPYRRLLFTAQALPWLETNFRVTQVLNRIEPASVFFGNEQSFYDRGIDFKVRLLEESAVNPELSFGFRDVGGTNLFSSEYIVASRRYYNTDFTFGLAWGNLGSRGGLKNPLSYLSSTFSDRGTSSGAGTINNSFFRGKEVSPFGGIEYVPEALPGWRFKAEYDANSYQSEPLDIKLKVRSPINAGVEYRPYDFWHISAASERGDRLMLRTSFAQVMDKRIIAPKIDSAPLPLQKPEDLDLPPRLDTLTAPCGDETAPEIRTIEIQEKSRMLHVISRCAPSQAAYTAALDKALALQPNIPQTLDIRLIQNGTALNRETFTLADARNAETVYSTFAKQLESRQTIAAERQPALVTRLKTALEVYNIELVRLTLLPPQATLDITQGRYNPLPKSVGRAARAAFSVLPPSITSVCVRQNEGGLIPRKTCVSRDEFTKMLAGTLPSAALLAQGERNSLADNPGGERIKVKSWPDVTWGLGTGYRQLIGGPDQYYAGQLYASLFGQVDITEHAYIAGNYGQDLVNNFDGLQLPGDSKLPAVRTLVQDYFKQGKSGIFTFNANYVRRLYGDWYGRAVGGILETMYSGIGGEVLYAPLGKPYAIGGEFYKVQQRGFKADFSLRDYTTTTGHVNFYYDIPYKDVRAAISAGRYLAGDDGVTVDLSRRFESGIRAGIFATITDVSADKFGEGSFDKGFYVSIPVDVFFVKERRGARGLTYRPTTRDGGARLDGTAQLYPMLENYKDGALRRDWPLIKD
jgi:hypothetical protein